MWRVGALLLCSCVTVPDMGAAPTWAEPSFTTGAGVLVRVPEGAADFLTPAMAEVLEADLFEALAVRGVPEAAARACLLGVTVIVVDAPRSTCRTRVGGELREVACVGATDGRWWARVARLGRCAYNLGSRGPPYAHELAHVVLRCTGRVPDWGHTDPVWEALHVERPCP